MSMMDWIVIVGGLTAIVWINWYFFLSQRRAVDADVHGDRNEYGGSSNMKTN